MIASAAAEREGLLADVIANPGDDAPRLIYADWLEIEGGELDRAEFIRVQCELAGLPPVFYHSTHASCFHDDAKTYCYQCRDPRRRERELLKARLPAVVSHGGGFASSTNEALWLWPVVGPLWLRPAAGPLAVCVPAGTQFRRGFVESVTVSCDDWLAHGPALVRAAPLRGVQLSDRQPQWSGAFGKYPSLCGWGPDTPTSQPPSQPSARLPPPLLECFRGHLIDLDWNWYSRHWRLFRTEADALAALSDACLACARGGH